VKTFAAAAVLALLAAIVPAAQAQEVNVGDGNFEGGIRWWWSRGKTQWSHDASSVNPALYGNPTSTLVYDQLDANSIEAMLTKRGSSGWLVNGNIGIGTIYRGQLHDMDFGPGQAVVGDSTSTHADGDVNYWTLDAGYDFLRPGPRTSLGVFGGFNFWKESVTASGAQFSAPGGFPQIPTDIQVINNSARWKSIRLGLIGRAQVTDSLHITGNVAAVPRTWMTNKDSHFLRADLGPTPNINMDGTGHGVQAEAELRYALWKPVELTAGVRYWKLKATGNIRFADGPDLPLTNFESTRYGATLGLVARF
jgi:outer membrane protease